MRAESDKCRRKALKVAASVRGVESVSVTGRGQELLLVVGVVDEVSLIEKLKEKVGDAEVVDLRTPRGDAALVMGTDAVVVAQSPYRQWPRHQYSATPGRSMHGGGHIEYDPVISAAAAGGGRHHADAGAEYYPRTPSPLRLQYHQNYLSPLAGQAGGYGYGYAGGSREARSHPANYSPMIARHDSSRAVVGWPRAEWRGHGRDHGGGGGPNCCSIL
ncbi:hypothetical protein PR202_ga20005 [Eleusine coracana subsp. coracana]|uniref:HMA domain-containing protein n=1 Tax=Eleusine coracana subsp. coracana TaxID=191504 RepID=A0AAV5CWA3_ELECO|nr:hypothetical protein PR202_ga20005 [Eleusine coracana subsp. coracana]